MFAINVRGRCAVIGLFFCAPFCFDGNPTQAGELTADAITGSVPYVDAATRFLERISPKIVGGKQAKPQTYKWQTSLQVSWIDDPVQAHFCGGSLVAPGWVLTAGHCVVNQKATDFTVVAGTTDLGKGGQRRSVARILLHKDYAVDSTNIVAGPHPVNDVALIKLFSPFNMNADLQIVPLVDAQTEAPIGVPGMQLSVTGFGATTVGGQSVKGLMEADVNYVDRTTCNANASYDGAITEGMLCAGETQGGKDLCQGDSGGPLTFHPLSPDVKQLGIVGWGVGCAQPLKFGVYTRVSAYHDWISGCIANPDRCPAK